MSKTVSRIWHDKLQQATEIATQATRLEFSKSYSDAFEAYVRAGQLYLWLVRNLKDRGASTRGNIGRSWSSNDGVVAGSSSDGAALLSSSFGSKMSLALSDAEMRDRLKRSAFKVMERAEKIKNAKRDVKPVQRQTLSYEEQSTTLSVSAKIGKLTFPAWTEPSADEFEGQIHYEDPDGQPGLSPAQKEHGAQYRRVGIRRAGEAPNGRLYDQGGFGRALRGRHIMQDIVTDCSFVAALEVAAEHDRRWGTKLATSALYPKDPDTGSVRQSPSGKYVAKLVLNGTARRVVFDDNLPCYPDGRLMCATSRNGQQTWPALLEKAYLKVMGGYDFPGSNSSIDLHALTGWIPEHVFLRHAGFQREKMWKRILTAWSRGKCMVTAGTGSLVAGSDANEDYGRSATATSPQHPLDGLVPCHDYAVLALIERTSRRYVLLMNPWSRAVGKRPGLAVPMEEEKAVLASLSPGAEDADDEGGFLVSWDDLCSTFDSLYLNWDPAHFKHSLEVHSTWRSPTSQSTAAVVHPQSVGQNPQFRLTLDPDGTDGAGGETEVWLLLVRHISSGKSAKGTTTTTTTTASSSSSSSTANAGDERGQGSGDAGQEESYMALHVFEHEADQRVYKPPRDGKRIGSYVDGTHNLVRFKASSPGQGKSGSSGGAYTVVVSRHGPGKDVNYTLSAFSTSTPLNLRELPHAHPYKETIEGSWSGRSAGGNITYPTFMHNPQYAVTISSPQSGGGVGGDGGGSGSGAMERRSSTTSIEAANDGDASLLIVLESTRSLPIHASLIWSTPGGSRVTQYSEGDVLISSGAYRHGLCVCEAPSLRVGTYTLVVSTFEPGCHGPFALTVQCSRRVAVKAIPQEGAGMYSRTVRGRWEGRGGRPSLRAYEDNPMWSLKVKRDSVVVSRVKSTTAARLGSRAITGDDEAGPGRVSIQSDGIDIPSSSSAPAVGVGQNEVKPRPYINVALFSPTCPALSSGGSSGGRLGREVATSGPYVDHVCGAALPPVRVRAGEYILVASTYARDAVADFSLDVYVDSPFEIEQIR